MFRTHVSACAIVLAALGLSGCEEPQTAEDIVATTESNLPGNAAMIAPANWFIVPTSAEMPLLLSGTSGPQRIVRYNKNSGYELAIVNFDCQKGVSVREVRSAERDRATMVVDRNPSADALGISGHLQSLCNAPENYRRVQGTLGEAVQKMRAEMRADPAREEVGDAQVKGAPEMRETRETITLEDGTEATVVTTRRVEAQ